MQKWRKSTFSGDSSCLEVRQTSEGMLVRDTKVAGGPILSFTADEWTAFLAGVRAGEFELDL